MEIAVKAQSKEKELKSILFDSGEKVEFADGVTISYTGGDAEFTGFESAVIVEMEAEVNSTESLSYISEFLHDKLKDLDEPKVIVNDQKVGIDEEVIRRKLLKAYYRN